MGGVFTPPASAGHVERAGECVEDVMRLCPVKVVAFLNA